MCTLFCIGILTGRVPEVQDHCKWEAQLEQAFTLVCHVIQVQG